MAGQAPTGACCRRYLIQVFTGYRRGAGTSAQVRRCLAADTLTPPPTPPARGSPANRSASPSLAWGVASVPESGLLRGGAEESPPPCFPSLAPKLLTDPPSVSKVILTLYGAEGRSEPLLLQHPQAPGLEAGSLDAFLLSTQRPLGTLHAARLWHTNSGASPSW